jgi:hypothetical protein
MMIEYFDPKYLIALQPRGGGISSNQETDLNDQLYDSIENI